MTAHTIRASDGTRLWVADSSPPVEAPGVLPIVFLHGFSGSSSATRPFGALTSRAGRRLVAPDMRAHGLSEKPAGREGYSLGRFAEDVADVLDDLALPRVHLVGHCLGGMVAAAFALARPDRIASLALVGTSLQPAADRGGMACLLDVARPALRPLLRRLCPADGPGRHVDYSSFRRMGDWYWRRLLADYRVLTWDAAEAIGVGLRPLDLRAAANSLGVPTLVAHGMRDTVFPAAAAEHTLAAIRESRLLLLPRENHVSLVLDPGSGLFGELLALADAAETPA